MKRHVLLLDTNVLIDYLAKRKQFSANAVRLRIAHVFGDVELWVNVQSYLDALYVLRRAGASQLNAAMLESLQFLNVCSVTGEDLQTALEDPWNDVEDQIIARGAERVNADYIITRNAGDFSRSKVPALTPEQYLTGVYEEHGITYDEFVLDDEEAKAVIAEQAKRLKDGERPERS